MMLKMISERIEKGEIRIEDILKSATRSKSKNSSRAAAHERLFTIINSRTYAKIAIANTFLEYFGNPVYIQISYDQTQRFIIVGNYLLDTENRYDIRKDGNKGIIYNKGLVEELTAFMKLDFSHKVSITFQKIVYLNDDKYKIALIKA